MDAPQFPGAETSADPTGAQPPGQASAFRRALDAQLEPADPSMALVPSGAHDLTAPIDVSSIRAALALAPPGLPSASGPTVVMPSVSVPALRAPTTIAATTTSTSNAGGGNSGDNGDEPPEHSPRHGGRPSRLPTTVGVSALLAAFAGAALVMVNNGQSTEPLAPTALPTKSVTQSSAPHAVPSVIPSHKASASVSPSHTTATPSHTASPSPSTAPSRPSGGSPAADASFATIYWTTDSEPLVADMQARLAKLNYLSLSQDGSHYSDTPRTLEYLGGWTPNPDGPGYYQNATDSAIRAFEFEYMQRRRGQFPGAGCSSQTYQALVRVTN